jgi:hypothetical protein
VFLIASKELLLKIVANFTLVPVASTVPAILPKILCGKTADTEQCLL